MTFPVEVVRRRGRPSSQYSPSEITLYGTPLRSLDTWIGQANDVKLTTVYIEPATTTAAANVAAQGPAATDRYYAGLIIAFAYQSHCYNLPEPMIIIVEGPGSPAHGYDFDQNPGYSMWKVEKLDRTMLLEPTSDTYEEIILKRAVMGPKQPMSYASHVQLSHRGGKLSE
jgi:hypothetical protein